MYNELHHLLRETALSATLSKDVRICKTIEGDTCNVCLYKGKCDDKLYKICLYKLDDGEYFK